MFTDTKEVTLLKIVVVQFGIEVEFGRNYAVVPRYNAVLVLTRFFMPKVFLPHLRSNLGKFLAKLVNAC